MTPNLTLVDDLVVLAATRLSTTDPTVVKRRLELLRPLEQLWLGQAQYAYHEEVDLAGAMRAIAGLAGPLPPGNEVVIVTEGGWEYLPHEVGDYVLTLSGLVEDDLDTGVRTRLDPLDREEAEIIGHLVRALLFNHATNGPAAIMEQLALGDLWRLIVRASYAAVAGCYFAAVHDDLAALRRLAPVVRLLAQVIPIGMVRNDRLAWLFVCP